MLIARYDRSYQRHQSLRQHAENTANKASENLKQLKLEHLGLLTGWLHDMGKSAEVWQNALENAKLRYLAGDQAYHPLDIPHAPPSARCIYDLLKSRAVSSHEKACLQIICLAVYAHHGYLMDALSVTGDDVFSRLVCSEKTEHSYDYDAFFEEVISKNSIFTHFTHACSEIKCALKAIPTATSHYPIKEKRDRALRFMLSLIVRSVYSALVDADRLDAAGFQNGGLILENEKKPPDWPLLINSLNMHLAGFEQIKPIDRIRVEISNYCAHAASWDDALLALHAPTGGGKTLSGLRWALIRAKEKKKKRIIYVVTYTTILDQVYDEYQKALKHCPDSVDLLLHHSNIIPDTQDDQQMSLDMRHSLEERQSLLSERWDADIILTTQVQFFNALYLGTAKAARRLRGLCDSVIIFDEVQTVPPQLSHLFNIAINYLTGVCGCEVLLSSATQPPFDRMTYPLPPVRSIFDTPDSLFGKMRRVELVDERGRGAMNALDAAYFAYEKQLEWKTCLVVLNTRSAARNIYDALTEILPANLNLHLLSNDLCPAHRKKIIQRLYESDEPCICVSTQLIECGVDLSFGCVIRSLAGADNIWQAAGRCNRNDDGSVHPVYIILCADENLVRLRDIRQAQEACVRTLHGLNHADDLQMPSNMADYFGFYFHNLNDRLSFPVRHNGVSGSMVGLLSDNPKGYEAYGENNPGVNLPWPLFQAFGTAGKSFSVIDSPSIALIVPYQEGESIIKDLNGSISTMNEKALLRKAQLYSINIYQPRLCRLLEQGGVFSLPCGAYALLKEWYDGEKRGLMEEPTYNADSHFG